MEDIFEIYKVDTDNNLFKFDGNIRKISYDYFLFEKYDDDELNFSLAFEYNRLIFFTIFSDIIGDDCIKIDGNKYCIKLPMWLFIQQKYLKIPEYVTNDVIIHTNNELKNKKIVCRVNYEELPDEQSATPFRQIIKYYNHFRFRVYGMIIKYNSKIIDVELIYGGFYVKEFDEIYIRNHGKKINDKTVYIPLNEIDDINNFSDNNLYSYNLQNTTIRVTTENNDKDISIYLIKYNKLLYYSNVIGLRYLM